MSYARAPALILLMLFFSASSGCSWLIRTRTKTKTTGLFKDNLQLMLDTFNKVENGKTTVEEWEKFGFPNWEKLGKERLADNVEFIVGVPAFHAIYGPEVFRNLDPEKLKNPDTLSEFNRYRLVRIPYVKVKTEEDRWYISTKETIRVGDEVMLSTVFFDKTVIYHAPQVVRVNEKETDHAFAQGLIELIERLAGITDSVRDLIDEFRNK